MPGPRTRIDGWSALAAVLLVGCGGSASSDALPCGSGTHLGSGPCVVTVTCGPGTTRVGDTCLPGDVGAGATTSAVECGAGTRLVGHECLPDTGVGGSGPAGHGGSSGAASSAHGGVGGDGGAPDNGGAAGHAVAGTSNDAGASGDAGASSDAGTSSDAGAAGSAGSECPGASLPFVDLDDLPSPAKAVQLIYAPRYAALVLRNAASSITVVDTGSGQSLSHAANAHFTDISLSPDGRFVFAADYGGENIGYGTPLGQSYVHRLDLEDGSWEVKTADIAGGIEATAANRFAMKSLDQWVSFTYNEWGPGPAVAQLSSRYSAVYAGDFAYDFRTSRLLHGNSGISSPEVNAFKIVGTGFVTQEGTGTYGSAYAFGGGSTTLSSDGSAFYYGRLSVDAQDVSRTLGVFPEAIYAATGAYAFGHGKFYDAHTQTQLGALGFDTTVYGLNANGSDFWTFDSAANELRHFAPTGWCGLNP